MKSRSVTTTVTGRRHKEEVIEVRPTEREPATVPGLEEIRLRAYELHLERAPCTDGIRVIGSKPSEKL